ncbi:hypothetical protein K439DRAFT_1611592 [Ramaria rubella]|nr:hypothetical protein K439DRAFT_1611592 [Ramaria rubella]
MCFHQFTAGYRHWAETPFVDCLKGGTLPASLMIQISGIEKYVGLRHTILSAIQGDLEGLNISLKIASPTLCINGCVKQFHTLIDLGNESLKNYRGPAFTVGGAGWGKVNEKESVIFINAEENPEIIIFINIAVKKALVDRKGVRPNHPGEIIQFGYN